METLKSKLAKLTGRLGKSGEDIDPEKSPYLDPVAPRCFLCYGEK
jgi:hypothetical protein